MLIDWYTVAAQVFNFLLLVWVLKRFLYTPVRRAMHQRQERIAQDIHQAEQARREAEESLQALKSERGKLNDERRHILEQAQQEARQWSEQALEQARTELEARRAQWDQALQDERKAFSRRLTASIAGASVEVCRKALLDLADADLELRLVETLLARLPEDSAPQPGEIRVRTGFALRPEGRKHLREALLRRWPGCSTSNSNRARAWASASNACSANTRYPGMWNNT